MLAPGRGAGALLGNGGGTTFILGGGGILLTYKSLTPLRTFMNNSFKPAASTIYLVL